MPCAIETSRMRSRTGLLPEVNTRDRATARTHARAWRRVTATRRAAGHTDCRRARFRRMKTMMFVLVLALVGCAKKSPDCGKAIDHSMELSKDMMKKMGVDDAMMQKMKDVGVQHCKDDKWAPE